VVWGLDEAQAVVLGAFAAVFFAVVGGDVAVVLGGSGFATGLGGVDWEGPVRLGRVCRRLDGAGRRSGVLSTIFVVTGRCDVAA
jgi:hypothetical protein